jgi:predicted aspartyl protease
MKRRHLLAAFGAALPMRAWAACAPRAPLASVPLQTDGFCVVPVTLAGQTVRMVLDTGAERSVLTRATVARLGLSLDDWVGTAMRGAGGRLDEHRNAIVPGLALGGMPLYQREPRGPLSMPVMALDLGPVAGLLGGDLLHRHTLDLDVPGGRLALLPPDTCPNAGDAIRLTMLRRFLMLARVMLDDRALQALVDTGAGSSLLNARGLYRMGLDQAALARDPTHEAMGLGGNFLVKTHIFGSLSLGRLRIEAPSISINAVPEPAFDMVLGMDMLKRQRLTISYSHQSLTL